MMCRIIMTEIAKEIPFSATKKNIPLKSGFAKHSKAYHRCWRPCILTNIDTNYRDSSNLKAFAEKKMHHLNDYVYFRTFSSMPPS